MVLHARPLTLTLSCDSRCTRPTKDLSQCTRDKLPVKGGQASVLRISCHVVRAVRCVYRVAAGNNLSRKRNNEVASPARGFIYWIVRTQYLCATGNHGIASGRVVCPRLFGVGIGARSDQIALLNQLGYIRGKAIVALDESSIGLVGFSIREQHAAAKRRMSSRIDGADGTLIHQEDNLATRTLKGWPAARLD